MQKLRAKQLVSDFRKVFTPPTMLLVSSPMERKVAYLELKDFKAVKGTVLPLIDSGLSAPYGIAWDASRSALYVADGGLRKIFRVHVKAYKCKRQCKGVDIHMKTDGNQYTIVEDVVSQWLSVDTDGDLFFTDQTTQSVSKLPVETIQKIVEGKILAKDLKRTTEAEVVGSTLAAGAVAPLLNVAATTVSTSPRPPSIYELYAASACPNVGTPAGVIASGAELYWTNQVGGFGSGSVVTGKTNPSIKTPTGNNQSPTFQSDKFANNTGSAYGIAVTDNMILFTDSSHAVYAASKGTGNVVTLSSTMLKPRGIVWDHDNTAYVADEEGNFIKSMPCGLLKANAPVAHTVDIHSPFGIAMIRPYDMIWAQSGLGADSGTPSASKLHCVIALFAGVVLAMMF